MAFKSEFMKIFKEGLEPYGFKRMKGTDFFGKLVNEEILLFIQISAASGQRLAGIRKDIHMTIRDLIRKTQCDTVMSMISLHYGTEHIRKFEALYNKLKNNSDLPCESSMTISINAYREADSSDDMIPAESFDENQ